MTKKTRRNRGGKSAKSDRRKEAPAVEDIVTDVPAEEEAAAVVEEAPETVETETKDAVDEIIISREVFETLKAGIEQLEEYRDHALRLRAEFENFRKRVQREQEQFTKFALESLMRDMLEVFDGFDRALDHAPDDEAGRAFVEGMKMVRQQMWRAFENRGLERLAAVDEAFDPEVHEAIDAFDSPDVETDTVINDVRAGYKLGGRLLRASQVRVARARREIPLEEPEAQETDDDEDHRD